MAREAQPNEWLLNIIIFIGGALIGFLLVNVIVAVAAGLYFVIFIERKYSMFIDNFIASLEINLFNFSNYSYWLLLIFNGIAALLGFNNHKINHIQFIKIDNPKSIFLFYAVISCLIFVARRIIVVATIPHKYAKEPPRVLHEMFSINLYFLIVYTTTFLISVFFIIYLFSHNQSRIRRLCS